jgi:hypothetical protein
VLQVYIIFVLKEDPQSGNRLSSHTLSRERERAQKSFCCALKERRESERGFMLTLQMLFFSPFEAAQKTRSVPHKRSQSRDVKSVFGDFPLHQLWLIHFDWHTSENTSKIGKEKFSAHLLNILCF